MFGIFANDTLRVYDSRVVGVRISDSFIIFEVYKIWIEIMYRNGKYVVLRLYWRSFVGDKFVLVSSV